MTLGGYDASRIVWHNVTFALNAAKLPQTYIQGISIFSSAASSNFTNSSALLTMADRVTAIIDSSTPYLWLPESVCDKFATALGLVYDYALNLYTFGGNDSSHDSLVKSQLSFNFTLIWSRQAMLSTSLYHMLLSTCNFDIQLSPTRTMGPPTLLGITFHFAKPVMMHSTGLVEPSYKRHISSPITTEAYLVSIKQSILQIPLEA